MPDKDFTTVVTRWLPGGHQVVIKNMDFNSFSILKHVLGSTFLSYVKDTSCFHDFISPHTHTPLDKLVTEEETQ